MNMNFEAINPVTLVTVGSIVAAVYAFLDKVFERIVLPAAVSEASTLGHFAESTITALLPPEFRPLVETELAALASKAGSDALTVKGAASAILAKIAPQVPAATITDVLNIVSESTTAFVAALDPNEPTPTPSSATPPAPFGGKL